MNDSTNVLLEVKDLYVRFDNHGDITQAVDKISFSLRKGQCLGIVGESGSGKSVTSFSILNLLQSNTANETKGSIYFLYDQNPIDLLHTTDQSLYTIRGQKISMVFQEPMSALNPVRRCGHQVKEVLDIHNIGNKNERKDFILRLFQKVALQDVERIYDSYPHELSGGQLQRVNIAMALAPAPDILICDEPTTALDVTIQKQILQLLKKLTSEFNTALIFISHDLDVVGSLCDSVLVMYQGTIVEQGLVYDIFDHPNHPYTKALMSCKPSVEAKDFVLPTVDEIVNDTFAPTPRTIVDLEGRSAIISVSDLKVYFSTSKSLFGPSNYVKALDGVSFDLHQGEILGIVGESGSGKSTIANCIAGLLNPTDGYIKYENILYNPHSISKDLALRTKIQLVFQDPYSSLNPIMTIGKAILQPLVQHNILSHRDYNHRVNELLDQVGLDQSYRQRYPHQLSGGQRQRVCIARSLSVNPKVLICDESVSALDVSVQAQILNLLDHLRATLDLSILFISHDLAVVHYICDNVIVMKNGKIVEKGDVNDIMHAPTSEYTKKLVASAPDSHHN